MPACRKIKRKKRQVCIGDLDRRIILNDRAITPPVFGDPDFTEEFSGDYEVWAMINTVSGKTIFDGVSNVDVNVTQEIYTPFDKSVTADTWVDMDGSRLDIITVENLDERSEFLLLMCIERGPIGTPAAEA